MSEMAAEELDSDVDDIDITGYGQRSRKLKKSKSAWTKEEPKSLREEIEIEQAQAEFYQGILDVIIAHLDPEVETKDVDRIVLPPRVPNDVRKKLRKYRVEAKNIIEFIEDKIGDDCDDDKGNEDDKAESSFLASLMEKLCSAVKQDTISSKFKLPRVPIVDAERKERLKGYRKGGNEIVDSLKRLKTQRIDKITQTDFPEEPRKVTQTRVTEYIETKSAHNAPETKKKIKQRTRQTQTDFEDQIIGKASVISPTGQQTVTSASPKWTVLSSPDVIKNDVERKGQPLDLSKTVKGVQGQDFSQQQHQPDLPYPYQQNHHQQQPQHQHYHYHQQQEQQRNSNENVHGSRGAIHTEEEYSKNDNVQHNMHSGGEPRSGQGHHANRPDVGPHQYATHNVKSTPQRPTDMSKDEYINTMEAQILKLSCQVSLLESKLHESQRSLVITAYSNDAVLDRVSNIIQSQDREMTEEMSNLADRDRPIKLAELFVKLYDSEWVDIFQFETNEMKKPEQKAIADILEITQSIYETCIRLAKDQIEDWAEQIGTCERSELPKHLKSISKLKDDDLFEALKQTQLKHAKECMPFIRQEISSNEAFTSFYGPELASCEPFVFACVDVCWLMAVKEPPMYLDFSCKPGSKVNKDVYSSYTKTGNKMDFLVWPPVYIYEKGHLLYKGVLQPQ
ncbi:uncharacterized protein [Argopecten irradians]|uniref:uncharacterized protein isoform X2 n=1 Tax=Argopecten irradians TaxID=31199 RepID=UPI003712E9C6